MKHFDLDYGNNSRYFFLNILMSLAFSLCFSSVSYSASKQLILNDDSGQYLLGKHMDVFQDPSGTLELRDLLTPSISKNFEPSLDGIPGFGFSNSNFWLRFRVKNLSTRTKQWIFEVSTANLSARLFIPHVSGEYLVKEGNVNAQFELREIKHRKLNFYLPSEWDENAADGMFRIDSGGHFVTVNQSFLDIIGCDSGQILQQNFSNNRQNFFVDHNDYLKLVLVLEQNSPCHFEARLVRCDKDKIWVNILAHNTTTFQSIENFIDASVLDISVRKDKEQAQLKQKTAVEANKSKEKFI